MGLSTFTNRGFDRHASHPKEFAVLSATTFCSFVREFSPLEARARQAKRGRGPAPGAWRWCGSRPLLRARA